ncbi:MAG: anhydro-N-acetylmuramic acid kinase [Magnetococcales bacterium]|nr:anhydro-N-acetylmuramic acid kinase [Magnetococcales bacterium]
MDEIMVAIGLISGTSADGIDAVVIRSDGIDAPEVLQYLENPYPASVRQEVLDLYNPGPDEIERMGRLDRVLGELFAKAALGVCKAADLSPSQIDVIGSHGQTIRHRPPDFTMQIANPAIISARTGIKTIADFRQADMALGGEGAPLLPLLHKLLFSRKGESCGILNLGGIANLTVLSPDGEVVVAGDTGPANTLLDMLVTKINGLDSVEHCFDAGGEGAGAGNVDLQALQWLLGHDYFSKSFPKSTGREVFGLDYLDKFLSVFPNLSNNDGLATLTRFSVETIGIACEKLFFTDTYQLVLCGGGAHNPTMIRMLQDRLPTVNIVTSHEMKVNVDSLESQYFAWSAIRTLKGLCSSVPEATGAKKAAILGTITAAL